MSNPDDPEDVISKSTTMEYDNWGRTRELRFPLSQYSDEELLERATELVERNPRHGDSHTIAWEMGFVSLEMNRRLFQEIMVDDE